MTRVINVRRLQDRMVEIADFEVTPKHIFVLGEILAEMAKGRRQDAYSNYLPHLHLDRNPPNRRITSEVLGFLWGYCQQNLFPEFNYLLVEKRSGYPGKYMKETWKKHYGKFSMFEFERYCSSRAQEATRMLNMGFVGFNTEGMITRGEV